MVTGKILKYVNKIHILIEVEVDFQVHNFLYQKEMGPLNLAELLE